MKTRVVSETIPAKTIERTIYMCSWCEFQSYNEQKTHEHAATKHGCHCLFEVPDDDNEGMIGFFHSEDLAEKFMVQKLNAEHISRKSYWDGSGWYYFHTEDYPCASGCCSERVVLFTSVENFYDDSKEKINKLEQQIRVVKQTIENHRGR